MWRASNTSFVWLKSGSWETTMPLRWGMKIGACWSDSENFKKLQIFKESPLNCDFKRLISLAKNSVDSKRGGADAEHFSFAFSAFEWKTHRLDDMCNLIKLNILCLFEGKYKFPFSGGWQKAARLLTSSCWWVSIARQRTARLMPLSVSQSLFKRWAYIMCNFSCLWSLFSTRN